MSVAQSIKGFPAGFKRICRRAGAQRCTGELQTRTLPLMLDRFVQSILLDAVTAAQVQNHKIVSLADVTFALRRHKIPVYGAGTSVAVPSQHKPQPKLE